MWMLVEYVFHLTLLGWLPLWVKIIVFILLGVVPFGMVCLVVFADEEEVEVDKRQQKV